MGLSYINNIIFRHSDLGDLIMKKLTGRQYNKLRYMIIIALTKGSKFKLLSSNNVHTIGSLSYLLWWVNRRTMTRLTANRIIRKN